MELSDGLLGFELGKYADGEVGRYDGTQLGCCAGVINETWQEITYNVPLGRQGRIHPWGLQTLTLSMLTIAG